MKELALVKAALANVEQSVAHKDGWDLIGKERGITMHRRSIQTTSTDSELSFKDNPTKTRARASKALKFRLSRKKNKPTVRPVAGGPSNDESMESNDHEQQQSSDMEEGRGSQERMPLAKDADRVPRKRVSRLSSKFTLPGWSSLKMSGGSNVSKATRSIYHGFADATIEASASLVMAWFCDDKFKKGVREFYERDMFSVDLEIKNDHHLIDYRQINLGWPLKPRFVCLNQLRMQDEDGVCWCISTSSNVDRKRLVGLDDHAIRAEYFSIFRVTPRDEKLCDVVMWCCSDPRGSLPAWALRSTLPEILGVLGHCKIQLDDSALIAKRITFSERMNMMRKRVAIKWNNEALVEKCCNLIGGLLAKFVIGFSYSTVIYGTLAFILEESLSDVLTIIMCKTKLSVDMVRADLRVESRDAILSQIISTLSVAISCIAAFVFVQQFILPDALPADYFTDMLGLT